MVELSCTFLPPCLNIAPATAEWLYLALPTLSQSYTRCHKKAVPCFCALVLKLYPISQNCRAMFCHLVSKLYPLSQNGRTMLLPLCLKAIPDITEWPCHAFATLSKSYTRYHRMAVPCFAILSQSYTRCHRMAVPCFCHLVSKLYPISQNGRAMFLPPCLKAIPDITEWPYHVFATLSQSYTRCHRMAVPCFCLLVSKLYPLSQNGRAMLRLVAFWSQGHTRYRRTAVPCCIVLRPCLKTITTITDTE